MKKKDKLIWQSQTLLKPTSCNCFLIQPGSLKKKRERRKTRGKKKKGEGKGEEKGEGKTANVLRKKRMEENGEIKVLISFVANQCVNYIFAPFFPFWIACNKMKLWKLTILVV